MQKQGGIADNSPFGKKGRLRRELLFQLFTRNLIKQKEKFRMRTENTWIKEKREAGVSFNCSYSFVKTEDTQYSAIGID